jgi:hypothetical protein
MTLGMIGRLRPSLIALPTIMSGYNRRDQLRKKCDRTMLFQLCESSTTSRREIIWLMQFGKDMWQACQAYLRLYSLIRVTLFYAQALVSIRPQRDQFGGD